MLALVATCQVTNAAAEERWTLEIPFDSARQQAECPFEPNDLTQGPQAVIDYMKDGAAEAVACVEWLDEHLPGWQQSPGADQLVAPFVSYLLGDGTRKGLERHAIFVHLLGHLEKIEPGWRYDPSVREHMPQLVLASTVEDPFVADFWSTALREMDPDWRDSEAANSVVPKLYERALEEAAEPPTTRNERPGELLRQVSWPSYARLKVYTIALDTWPKRALSFTLTILIVALAARTIRRRKKA